MVGRAAASNDVQQLLQRPGFLLAIPDRSHVQPLRLLEFYREGVDRPGYGGELGPALRDSLLRRALPILDFFWRYQIDHMFNRYVFWNFIGRESTVQDTGVNWGQLFGIPFFVALFGLYYLFKNDWKIASVFLMLFVLMGYLITFYQNKQHTSE